MLPVVLALVTAATPPNADEARSLAAKKSWDTLYVTFGSADPEAYSAADRKKIGAALSRGCQQLEPKDALMAFTLGERARAFEADLEGLECLFRTAGKTDQQSVADDALEEGLRRFPKDGRFGFLLGRRLLSIAPLRAADALGSVPKKSRHYAEAQRLLAVLKKAQPKATSTAGGFTSSFGSSSSYVSGEDSMGRKTRRNDRFSIHYFRNRRDSAEQADYEAKVEEALDEAYEAARKTLGVTTEKPVGVLLYTREEYAEIYGRNFAERIAGQYLEGKLRLNDALAFEGAQRSVLVHEYAHAVVDELAQRHSNRIPLWLHEGIAEYVQWEYDGAGHPPRELAAPLRLARRRGQVPNLRWLTRNPPGHTPYPQLSYAVCATAVRLLIERGGMSMLVKTVEDLGRGKALNEVLSDRFGRTLEQLDEELASELEEL